MKQSRYPTEVCKLILANVKEYEQVKTENLQNKDRGGFELRRFKMDIKQISKLAQGVPITPAYLKVLKLEMSMNGWIVSEGITAELLFIKTDSLNNYTRLSIKPRVEGSEYDKLLSGADKERVYRSVLSLNRIVIEELPEELIKDIDFEVDGSIAGWGWITLNTHGTPIAFGIGCYKQRINKFSELDQEIGYEHGVVLESGDEFTTYGCEWTKGEK